MTPIPPSSVHHEHGRHPKAAAIPTAALVPAPALAKAEVAFVPDPDEVARRAYFSFVNQGCPMGQDVQHWLAAEAELVAEREKTRKHGFHNPT
jgi:hypothetical protein